MIKNTYDSLGRITGINHSYQDKTLADYHYKWDAANRITEINDDKYGYDKTNQLLSAVYAKKPKEQYAYDLNGNRSNHRIGGNNQLLNDGKEEYQYDAEGNRIAKGDIKYEWDHRNRLVKVETPQETIEYTYDYQNRLVSRKTEKGKEYFVHDGWQIALILNGNGSVKERLLWGTHQDELLAQGEKFMLNDHLNTVRDVISADGKVMSHYDYNAFGKQLNASSDTLQFAYTGKLTDSATGLQWNINRWYDANAGIWISEDPIGFKGKDINLTRYVGNMPITLLDMEGKFSLFWWFNSQPKKCECDSKSKNKKLEELVTTIKDWTTTLKDAAGKPGPYTPLITTLTSACDMFTACNAIIVENTKLKRRCDNDQIISGALNKPESCKQHDKLSEIYNKYCKL